MAAICYAYRLSPDEYRSLTLVERRAFVQFLKELAAKAKAG